MKPLVTKSNVLYVCYFKGILTPYAAKMFVFERITSLSISKEDTEENMKYIRTTVQEGEDTSGKINIVMASGYFLGQKNNKTANDISLIAHKVLHCYRFNIYNIFIQ